MPLRILRKISQVLLGRKPQAAASKPASPRPHAPASRDRAAGHSGEPRATGARPSGHSRPGPHPGRSGSSEAGNERDRTGGERGSRPSSGRRPSDDRRERGPSGERRDRGPAGERHAQGPSGGRRERGPAGERPERGPSGDRRPSNDRNHDRDRGHDRDRRRHAPEAHALAAAGAVVPPPAAGSATSAGPAAPAASVEPAAPWTLAQFDVPPQEGRRRFHDFELPVEIMHAIADLDFQYCTPIQADSLAHALAGRNVAGRAQTGTGKTAAFLVAILTRYLRSPESRPTAHGTPRALVIAPTRELVIQICHDAEDLGRYCNLRCLAVYGGMDYARQQRDLQSAPVDLLVATPGRLLDYQRQHVVDLSHVDTLVIDEADRMLDMGFIPDVRRIVRCLPEREKRRTLLYSATLTAEVMQLASQWMPDPVVIEMTPEQVAVKTVEQRVYIVASREKFTLLYNLLLRHEGQRVLIFCNRRIGAERLAGHLSNLGIRCELLSGDVDQRRRLRVIEEFRSGQVRIVVATDVAGRGLHIADIGLVVNYELPYEPEDYVHRIGRTGRAGNVGTAVSFACEDESFTIPEIEKYLGEALKCTMPDEDLLKVLPPRRERRDRPDRPHRLDRPPERPAPPDRPSDRSDTSDTSDASGRPAQTALPPPTAPEAPSPAAEPTPTAPAPATSLPAQPAPATPVPARASEPLPEQPRERPPHAERPRQERPRPERPRPERSRQDQRPRHESTRVDGRPPHPERGAGGSQSHGHGRRGEPRPEPPPPPPPVIHGPRVPAQEWTPGGPKPE